MKYLQHSQLLHTCAISPDTEQIHIHTKIKAHTIRTEFIFLNLIQYNASTINQKYSLTGVISNDRGLSPFADDVNKAH